MCSFVDQRALLLKDPHCLCLKVHKIHTASVLSFNHGGAVHQPDLSRASHLQTNWFKSGAAGKPDVQLREARQAADTVQQHLGYAYQVQLAE